MEASSSHAETRLKNCKMKGALIIYVLIIIAAIALSGRQNRKSEKTDETDVRNWKK